MRHFIKLFLNADGDSIIRIDDQKLTAKLTELFLLGITSVVGENTRLQEQLRTVGTAEAQETQTAVDPARLTAFADGVEMLTPTERMIFDLYIAHTATKDVLAAMNIKENTLKYHNKNLYSKLGVSSRKEIWELYRQLSRSETK